MGLNKEVNSIKLDKAMSSVVIVISLFFPGWSTIIAGILSQKDGEFLGSALKIGIMQILLIWCGIGWIWAIHTAYRISQNAK
jgi:hypothetical protein